MHYRKKQDISNAFINKSIIGNAIIPVIKYLDLGKNSEKGGKEMSGMIIALISGILMSVQGVWNAGVTKQSGIWMASGFVQLLALLVCIAAWFLTGKQGTVSDLMHVQPKYILLGGALGAFITYTVIQSMNQLGPAKSVMLIVCAQLIAAYLINLFGWFGAEKEVFEWRKLIGIVVFIIGVVIFKWK